MLKTKDEIRFHNSWRWTLTYMKPILIAVYHVKPQGLSYSCVALELLSPVSKLMTSVCPVINIMGCIRRCLLYYLLCYKWLSGPSQSAGLEPRIKILHQEWVGVQPARRVIGIAIIILWISHHELLTSVLLLRYITLHLLHAHSCGTCTDVCWSIVFFLTPFCKLSKVSSEAK